MPLDTKNYKFFTFFFVDTGKISVQYVQKMEDKILIFSCFSSTLNHWVLRSDAQLAAGSAEAAPADWQQQQQQLPHSCQEQQQQLPNNPPQQGENQGKTVALFLLQRLSLVASLLIFLAYPLSFCLNNKINNKENGKQISFL
jgi:hypothetical protein